MAKPKPKSQPALRPIPREFAPPRDLPGAEAHGAYPTVRMRRNLSARPALPIQKWSHQKCPTQIHT